MTKLNQIIAIEKSVKNNTHKEVSELYKAAQKPELFDGFDKNYRPINDDGERLPPESKRVQFQGEKVLVTLRKVWGELIDVTARKDWTNAQAKADIAVNGTILVKDVPVTNLLFLEKTLQDAKIFLTALPTLSEGDNWDKDNNSGLYKTASFETHRTKKIEKPLVIVPPTQFQAAIAKTVIEDVLTGYWNTVKLSGAMPKTEMAGYIANVDSLIKAVKQAREAANMQAEIAPSVDVGKALFDFVFSTVEA